MLLVEIEKKMFYFWVWGSLGGTSLVGVFLRFLGNFTWLLGTIQRANLLAQFFCKVDYSPSL